MVNQQNTGNLKKNFVSEVLSLLFTHRRLDTPHVTIFYQSNSSLNLLMADPESFPEARVVAVIFGFPSFLFNELS